MNPLRRPDRSDPAGARRRPKQLDLFPGGAGPRWTLTRPLEASRLRNSALKLLEGVRRHFPELESVTVRVGRTRSRRAHAWASLDPASPAVWIKPGALARLTVAHEFVHLLQARGLVPRGEKSADLHAIARHPELIDKKPAYLAVPAVLFDGCGRPLPGTADLLNRAARRAVEEAPGHPRSAIRKFERSLAEAGLFRVVPASLGAGGAR